MSEHNRLWLEIKIAKLRRLCKEVDPFGQISPELLEELEDLDMPFQGDPFKLTNQLIYQMENALEELGAQDH